MSADVLDYVAVPVSLIRKLGGNSLHAYILCAIHRLSQGCPPGEDGRRWVTITGTELAGRLGLSRDQVKRATKKLVDSGLLAAKVDNPEPDDRTLSYTIDSLPLGDSTPG